MPTFKQPYNLYLPPKRQDLNLKSPGPHISHVIEVHTYALVATVPSLYPLTNLSGTGPSGTFSASYLFPLQTQTPQFPQLISFGSQSFKSHLKLRNLFSPGCIKMSISLPHSLFIHFTSRSISHWVYPVEITGHFVSSNCGIVSAHSWIEAGWPSPG